MTAIPIYEDLVFLATSTFCHHAGSGSTVERRAGVRDSSLKREEAGCPDDARVVPEPSEAPARLKAAPSLIHAGWRGRLTPLPFTRFI